MHLPALLSRTVVRLLLLGTYVTGADSAIELVHLRQFLAICEAGGGGSAPLPGAALAGHSIGHPHVGSKEGALARLRPSGWSRHVDGVARVRRDRVMDLLLGEAPA